MTQLSFVFNGYGVNKIWDQIDRVVRNSPEWTIIYGYDGNTDMVYKKYGIIMDRLIGGRVRFSFDSEENYLCFKLRYL